MIIKLLIVVPTLNSYRLLPKLKDSLQSQTFQDWRCVFIDGPSCEEHRQWVIDCCEKDPRFQWSEQKPHYQKIFGAMNQGFHEALANEWILFWGSDDWAANTTVLQELVESIPKQTHDNPTDLVITRGRYANTRGKLTRSTSFSSKKHPTTFNKSTFRRKLFFGETPPHQGTLFGPSAQSKLNHYREKFPLSADLDYFLRLSNAKELNIRCLNLEIIHMLEGGASGQHTRSRFNQVKTSYSETFGNLWWIPFISRYIRRVISAVRQ